MLRTKALTLRGAHLNTLEGLTDHALERLQERYDPDDYYPYTFESIIGRIEERYGQAFREPEWEGKSRMVVLASLRRRATTAPRSIRLIYDRTSRTGP